MWSSGRLRNRDLNKRIIESSDSEDGGGRSGGAVVKKKRKKVAPQKRRSTSTSRPQLFDKVPRKGGWPGRRPPPNVVPPSLEISSATGTIMDDICAELDVNLNDCNGFLGFWGANDAKQLGLGTDFINEIANMSVDDCMDPLLTTEQNLGTAFPEYQANGRQLLPIKSATYPGPDLKRHLPEDPYPSKRLSNLDAMTLSPSMLSKNEPTIDGGEQNQGIADPEFLCKICRMQMYSAIDLQNHLVAVHKIRISSKKVVHHAGRGGVFTKQNNVCRSCEKGFKTKADYIAHRSLVTVIQCAFCDAVFPCVGSWTKHMLTNHLNDCELVCQTCNTTLTTRHNLVCHYATHISTLRYKCPFCFPLSSGNGFSSRTLKGISIHLNTHDPTTLELFEKNYTPEAEALAVSNPEEDNCMTFHKFSEQ